MTLFLTTAALFWTAFVIHIILWRIRLPHHQMRTLCLIYAVTFGLWLVAALLHTTPLHLILHTGLYYMACSFCYIITYSALEGDSPTLSLMRHISQRGTTGLGAQEVTTFLAKRPFVSARLDALIKSGLVSLRDNKYHITGTPSLFFRIILGYRKIYGPISRGG